MLGCAGGSGSDRDIQDRRFPAPASNRCRRLHQRGRCALRTRRDGALVYSGGLDIEVALATIGIRSFFMRSQSAQALAQLSRSRTCRLRTFAGPRFVSSELRNIFAIVQPGERSPGSGLVGSPKQTECRGNGQRFWHRQHILPGETDQLPLHVEQCRKITIHDRVNRILGNSQADIHGGNNLSPHPEQRYGKRTKT